MILEGYEEEMKHNPNIVKTIVLDSSVEENWTEFLLDFIENTNKISSLGSEESSNLE